VSINVDSVIKEEGLPERALETVVLLLGVVVVSLTCLAPGQSRDALGIELAAIGGALVLFVGTMIARSKRPKNSPPAWLASRITLSSLATVPFVLGGASLIAELGGGLYWVFGGIVGAIVAGVLNAWVLLVEIRR